MQALAESHGLAYATLNHESLSAVAPDALSALVAAVSELLDSQPDALAEACRALPSAPGIVFSAPRPRRRGKPVQTTLSLTHE